LLGVAALWSAVRGLELAAALRPSPEALAVGAACGLGLAVGLPLVTAPWAHRMLLLRGLRRAWDSLETDLGPSLGVREVLVLALCSAVSEEVFFRGVLQREVGIVAASAVFGLLHPLGIAYVLWAAAVGAGSHGITVPPDRTLAGVDAGAYDLVALPGGMPGTLHLREHAEVRRIVRELAERGRYTTAICAAPTVLAAAGVIAGRAVTSHPSV